VGDMPIYVGAQSADVWASQHLFELTGELMDPMFGLAFPFC
jgi:4-alpha-glucanotransferase